MNHTYNTRIPQDLWDLLQAEAGQQDLSVNQWLVRAIREKLARGPGEPTVRLPVQAQPLPRPELRGETPIVPRGPQMPTVTRSGFAPCRNPQQHGIAPGGNCRKCAL